MKDIRTYYGAVNLSSSEQHISGGTQIIFIVRKTGVSGVYKGQAEKQTNYRWVDFKILKFLIDLNMWNFASLNIGTVVLQCYQ